jgi:hypothetical protein
MSATTSQCNPIMPGGCIHPRPIPQDHFLARLPPPIQKAIELALSPPGQLFCGGLIHTGTGALAAGLLGSIHPVGGAIFGLTNFAAMHAVIWITDKWNVNPENHLARIAKAVLPIIAGIGVGFAVLNAVGFSITLLSSIVLTAGSAFLILGIFFTALMTKNFIEAAARQQNPSAQTGIRV